MESTHTYMWDAYARSHYTHYRLKLCSVRFVFLFFFSFVFYSCAFAVSRMSLVDRELISIVVCIICDNSMIFSVHIYFPR